MKIVYLHQYFMTPDMSGGTRSYEMARRLVAKGHEVHIVTSHCANDSAGEWFESIHDGITVHWLKNPYSNRMSFAQRIRSFLRFAIQASIKVSEIPADIIFATSSPLTIAIPAIYGSRRLKIPMVFEVRDLWPETPIAIGALRSPFLKFLAKRLEKFAYDNSSSVVALSPGMREGVNRSGYPKHKIAVIPNAADNLMFTVPESIGQQFRDARPWLGGNPLLVYAGTFGKVNGINYVVQMAKEFLSIDPKIRILLVGDGIEAEAAKTAAFDLGVLDINLFFEKSIPKRDMPALMAAANMASSFVVDIPELHANSANKFFDALAAGRPILINHGGWMADLINEHECGVVTWGMPLRDAAELVASKLCDSQWLMKANAAAKSLAVSRFDRDLLANELDSVLRQSAGEINATPFAITSHNYPV